MPVKLKLDLHTHPYECTGIREPDFELAAGVMAVIKARGLDGIAVTEHNDLDFGYKLKRAVEKHFPGQAVIVPGREIASPELRYQEAVELDLGLSNGALFRFLAHPSYPFIDASTMARYPVHAIELHNNLHDCQLNHARIAQVAADFGLMVLQNSDAHRLEDIGAFYNEVDLGELQALAGR